MVMGKTLQSAPHGATKSPTAQPPTFEENYAAFPGIKSATKYGKSTKAMLEAELLPPARDDFEESYVWYLERSADAADRFTIAIEDAIDKLRRDPACGIRLDDEHRFYRLKKRFPFYLVYRTEPTKIVIIAIAHNRRAPGY